VAVFFLAVLFRLVTLVTIAGLAVVGHLPLRMGASPGAALALTQMNAGIDARSVLPTIRVPTLVIHRTDDQTKGPLFRKDLNHPLTAREWDFRFLCKAKPHQVFCVSGYFL
jgi:pimeloyl-ACP methyl ester carboxylesterase